MPTIAAEVRFKRPGANSWLFGAHSAPRSNSPKEDEILVGDKRVRLTAVRSNAPLNSISTVDQTLTKQLVKALCLYYLHHNTPHQIDRIIVNRIATPAKIELFNIHSAAQGLKQPISKLANLNHLSSLNFTRAAELLDETEKGRAKLNCITHLFASLSATNDYDSFQELWKAFNAIYKIYAGSTKDFDCHRHVCNELRNHPNKFIASCAGAALLTKADILDIALFWNKMLQTNYPTQNKATALRDSILRNQDHRVLQAYGEKLAVRQDFLSNSGNLPSVLAHISHHTTAQTIRDADVVCLLCIKYAYFYRNLLMHAEQAHHNMRFHEPSAPVEKLVPHLRNLVIDLVNVA